MKEAYNDKIRQLIERLENVDNTTVINAFKNSKDIEITKVLFEYFCLNKPSLAKKIYENLTEEVKISLEESILHKDLTKEVISTLLVLGKETQKKYFQINASLLTKLQDYDNLIYKTLVDNERHDLYINYLNKFYNIKNFLPESLENLKLAAIENNFKVQTLIKSFEEELYENEKYQDLLIVADNTKTLNKLSEYLSIQQKDIFEKVKSKQPEIPYRVKRLAFLIQYDTELKGLNEWIKYINQVIDEKGKPSIHEIIELTIIKYKLIDIQNTIIKRSFSQGSNLIRMIQTSEEQITEDEKFELFFHHKKIFDKFYRRQKEYLDFIVNEGDNNPFQSYNENIQSNIKEKDLYIKGKKVIKPDHDYINFTETKKIKDYIEKEQETLKEETIVFIKEKKDEEISYDELFRLYFNSIFKYVLPLDTFIMTMNISIENDDLFRIYNTKMQGVINYIDNNYYLDTPYGNLKVTFLDDISPETICPGLKVSGVLSSYNYKEGAFRLTKLLWKLNEAKKPYYKEILTSCNIGEVIDEYHNSFNDEDFLIYSSLKSFIDYEYLYLKYKEEFSSLEDKIIHNMKYHLQLENEHIFSKIFTRYILNESKDELVEEIKLIIENILKSRVESQLEDLTNDIEFSEFREKFNIMMYYLKDIDIDFYTKIIEELREEKLMSCTYLNLEEKDYEYFEKIKANATIKNFYYNYPKYKNAKDELLFLENIKDKDLKFYIILKVLNSNPKNYDFLKEELINNFNPSTPYLSWISNYETVIYNYKDNSLMKIILGLEYNIEDYNEEEKRFIDEFKSTNIYTNNTIKGETIKEILQTIKQKLPDEVIQKLKELSKEELSDEEKIELAPIIVRLLTKSNIEANKLYKLLESLGTNNPYNMNNNFKASIFKPLTKEEITTIYSVRKLLDSPLKKYNYFCITPIHYSDNFNLYFKNIHKEQLKVILSKYILHGSIDVHSSGKLIRPYLTNIKIKESNVICHFEEFKGLPYKIIPHYDFIKFEFNELTDQEKLIITPIVNYEEDDELLIKSKEDKDFYNSLSFEDKKRVVLHYVRYNIIEAYKFDTEKVLSDEEYLELASLMDLYDVTCGEALYIYILLDKKEHFKRTFYHNKILRYRQRSLLDLQKYLVENEEWDLYERLIKYLKEENYLNKVFLLEEAIPKLNELGILDKYYKKFDPDDKIEKQLSTNDLSQFIKLKKLEITNLKYSYKENAYQIYLDRNKKYFNKTNKKELSFAIYILLKITFRNKEMNDEVFKYLKELNSNALIKNDLKVRKILLREMNETDENINELYEILKSTAKEKYLQDKDYNKEIEKTILFASFFTTLRNDIEILITETDEFVKYSDYLKNDEYNLDFLKNRIYSRINRIEKIDNLTIYSTELIMLLKELYELEKRYVKLNFEVETRTIINILVIKRIMVPQLIFFQKFRQLAKRVYPNLEKELARNSKKYPNDRSLKPIINKTFESYDVVSILNSKWIKKLFDLELDIKEINNYFQSNNYVTLYDINIIKFYKKLYEFQEDLVTPQYEQITKINIFMEFLIKNNIFFDEMILVGELMPYYESLKEREVQTKSIYSSENSAFSKRIKSIKSSAGSLDKGVNNYYLYKEENIEDALIKIIDDLTEKNRYEDAYYVSLQYIINFPNSSLNESIKKALSNEELLIPESRQEQAQDLYQKASMLLIENKQLSNLYDLTKLSERVNPYYSTTIAHEFQDFDYDFVINDDKYSNNEKIYLYLRSILKYGVNFNEFIKELYKEELTKNEYIKLDIKAAFIMFVYNKNNIKTPIKIDLNTDKFSDFISNNISLKILGAYKEKDNVIFDFKILESIKQSSSKLVSPDDELKNYIQNNYTYERILKAILQGRKEFSDEIRKIATYYQKESINKYILFNEKVFENIYAIFYTSKVLYENERHCLLKQYLYHLKNNNISNNRMLYNKFRENEYLFMPRLNSSIAISKVDSFIINNIDITKPLKEELLRLLNLVDDNEKIYIYYVICYKYSYFKYDLEFYYDEEIKRILIALIYELIKEGRSPKRFFEELKENNIFQRIENGEEKYQDIKKRAIIKYINKVAADENIEEFRFILNNKELEEIKDDNLKVLISNQILNSLSEKEKNTLYEKFTVSVKTEKEEV